MTDGRMIQIITGCDHADGCYWARAVVPMSLNGGREKHILYRKYETRAEALLALQAALAREFPGVAMMEH